MFAKVLQHSKNATICAACCFQQDFTFIADTLGKILLYRTSFNKAENGYFDMLGLIRLCFQFSITDSS